MGTITKKISEAEYKKLIEEEKAKRESQSSKEKSNEKNSTNITPLLDRPEQIARFKGAVREGAVELHRQKAASSTHYEIIKPNWKVVGKEIAEEKYVDRESNGLTEERYKGAPVGNTSVGEAKFSEISSGQQEFELVTEWISIISEHKRKNANRQSRSATTSDML